MKRWRELSQRHRASTVAVLALYLLVISAVLADSWLVHVDWVIRDFGARRRWPEMQSLIGVWVQFGQRAPALAMASAWLGYRAWRTRQVRPLVVLAVATLLLNVSVGGVKMALGRLGATAALPFDSAGLFQGGTLFPSGHTSNAVVTWGVLAYVALEHRRLKAALAGIAAFTIGLAALYEGYHWFSDILAGWAAGGLVLLALPVLEPTMARVTDWLTDRLRRWRRHASQLAPARGPRLRPLPLAGPERPLGGLEHASHGRERSGVARGSGPIQLTEKTIESQRLYR